MSSGNIALRTYKHCTCKLSQHFGIHRSPYHQGDENGHCSVCQNNVTVSTYHVPKPEN
jgi:hypothetical protein